MKNTSDRYLFSKNGLGQKTRCIGGCHRPMSYIKNVLSSAKRSQHVFWSVIFEGCEHEKRVVICKKITTCFLRSYCWKMTTYFICCHLPFLTLFLKCHLYKDLNAYTQVSSFSTDQNTDYVAISCSNHTVRNVFSSFTDHNALLGFWLVIFYR